MTASVAPYLPCRAQQHLLLSDLTPAPAAVLLRQDRQAAKMKGTRCRKDTMYKTITQAVECIERGCQDSTRQSTPIVTTVLEEFVHIMEAGLDGQHQLLLDLTPNDWQTIVTKDQVGSLSGV
jgi:hypothetical protein